MKSILSSLGENVFFLDGPLAIFALKVLKLSLLKWRCSGTFSPLLGLELEDWNQYTLDSLRQVLYSKQYHLPAYAFEAHL